MANTKQPARRRLGSIEDGGRQAGVSGRTIRRMISRGELIGYRFGPKLIRIDLDELAALARPIPSAGDAM